MDDLYSDSDFISFFVTPPLPPNTHTHRENTLAAVMKSIPQTMIGYISFMKPIER
jgi:hypothetical protein